MKSIRMENGVIVYYGNRVGRITGNRAVVDPMFEGPEPGQDRRAAPSALCGKSSLLNPAV